MTNETNEKITYTSSAHNLEVFHSRFDDALQRLRRVLGPTCPMYIDGQAATSDLPTILDVSPVDQTTLARAAEIIREGKYAIAALAAVEVGKSRVEAMGEVEESADLIDYYCGRMEDANATVRIGWACPVAATAMPA